MPPVQKTQPDPNEVSARRNKGTFTAEEQNSHPQEANADAALVQLVDYALWKDQVLRAMDYHEIDISVKSGTVSLSGHIVSTTSQDRIERALRTVPGIVEFNNHLVLDDQLTLKVAASLGALEHTYHCKFFTTVRHGVVSLSGLVDEENVKLLAEKYAASHPNVRGILNHIRVQGNSSVLADLPFLQPLIGEEISFLDGVSGIVRQVIINPNNRRVVAMAVSGRFADQRQELKALKTGEARPPEHLIVLTMDLVRYLTRFSGFLTINSTATKQYQNFDWASFCVPNVSWVPPYPYRLAEVLFPIAYQQLDNHIGFPSQVALTPKVEAQIMSEQLLTNDSLGG